MQSKPICDMPRSILRQWQGASSFHCQATVVKSVIALYLEFSGAAFEENRMNISASLSSKLPFISQSGFAWRHCRQANYESEWHMHDCAMLLWPQLGGLKTAWLDQWAAPEVKNIHSAKLTQSMAILLPQATAHYTKSDLQRQRHGELYLAPEILRGCDKQGLIQLDGATVAMLNALLAPALDSQSAEPLIRAIVSQLTFGGTRHPPVVLGSMGQRMIQSFAVALDCGKPLPSVEMIACELGVSMRQLQRICQSEFGASPIALRRRFLASHARTLLMQGQSLAQVSAHLDFANSGHLTRLLRSIPE